MTVIISSVEGVRGNREVPPRAVLGARGDPSGAGAEAYMEEEGGSRGKHGFPGESEPKASRT